MEQTLLQQLAAAPSPLPAALQQMVYTKASAAGDLRLLATLAARADLTAPLVDRLASDGHATVRAAWAAVPGRVAAAPGRFIDETRPSVLATVAKQPDLPAGLYETCASSASLKVAAALMLNPGTPPQLREDAAARLVDVPKYQQAIEEAVAVYPELVNAVVSHTGSLETATYALSVPGGRLSPTATMHLVDLFAERFTDETIQMASVLRGRTGRRAADRTGLRAAADAWFSTIALAADLTKDGSLAPYVAKILAVSFEEILETHELVKGVTYVPTLLHQAVQSVRVRNTRNLLTRIRGCSDPAELAELLNSDDATRARQDTYIRPQLTVAVVNAPACTPQLIAELVDSGSVVPLTGTRREWLRYAVSAHAAAGRAETALAAAALADLVDSPTVTAVGFAEAAGVDVATLQRTAVALYMRAGRGDLAAYWAAAGPELLPDDAVAALPADSAAAVAGPEGLTAYIFGRLGGDAAKWEVLLALAAQPSHTTVGGLVDAAARSFTLDCATRGRREGTS